MSGNPHRITREPATPDFVSQPEIPRYLTGSPPDGDCPQPDAAPTVWILKPTGHEPTFPVILYNQETGWVFRDAHTHGPGVRYLELGTHTESLANSRQGR
jgi:acetyl esterase